MQRLIAMLFIVGFIIPVVNADGQPAYERFDRLSNARLRVALVGHAIRRKVPSCCDFPDEDEHFFPSGVWTGKGYNGIEGKWYIISDAICISEKDPGAVRMLKPVCRDIWFDKDRQRFIMRQLDEMRKAPQPITFDPMTPAEFNNEPKGWDLKPGGHLVARRF